MQPGDSERRTLHHSRQFDHFGVYREYNPSAQLKAYNAFSLSCLQFQHFSRLLTINLASLGVVPPHNRDVPSCRTICDKPFQLDPVKSILPMTAHLCETVQAVLVPSLGAQRLHSRFDVVQGHRCVYQSTGTIELRTTSRSWKSALSTHRL